MKTPGIHRDRSVFRDDHGTAILEFTLIAMILFGLTFAVVDFSIVFWQANLADKATYQGTRQAVQSDSVAPGVTAWSGVVDGGLDPGTPLDLSRLDAFTVHCQSGACACTGPGCGAIGNPGYDATAFNRILTAVQMVDANGSQCVCRIFSRRPGVRRSAGVGCGAFGVGRGARVGASLLLHGNVRHDRPDHRGFPDHLAGGRPVDGFPAIMNPWPGCRASKPPGFPFSAAC
jgi:hypothetical protein